MVIIAIGPICHDLILHGPLAVSLVLHLDTVQIGTSIILQQPTNIDRVQTKVQPKTDCLKPEVCVLTIHDCIN